jgi:hypothetical protein
MSDREPGPLTEPPDRASDVDEPAEPETGDEWSSDDWRPEAKPRRERLRYEPRHRDNVDDEEVEGDDSRRAD